MVTALILGLFIFQTIYSLDYIFPDLFEKITQWHKDLFEPIGE